jgi:hypothetical protein
MADFIIFVLGVMVFPIVATIILVRIWRRGEREGSEPLQHLLVSRKARRPPR